MREVLVRFDSAWNAELRIADRGAYQTQGRHVRGTPGALSVIQPDRFAAGSRLPRLYASNHFEPGISIFLTESSFISIPMPGRSVIVT
jgi:hypothetical protein